MRQKLGSFLRSAAQFYAMFFTYVIVRGLIIEHGDDGSFSPVDLRRFIMPTFLSIGVVVIFVTLLYSYYSPIKSKPNYKIIVPILFVVIFLVEFCVL
jgi:hypothetical protein